jgi:hypothetical protein
MTLAKAHDQLGHMGEDAVRETAKHLGWDIKPGGLLPCAACAAGKAKQKNFSRASAHHSARKSNE